MNYIKNMLLYALEKNNLNYNKMLEYCNIYSNDRRYKPFVLACTTSGNSGIIQYQNMKYYFYKTINGLEVEYFTR